jgi:hypothetical protein
VIDAVFGSTTRLCSYDRSKPVECSGQHARENAPSQKLLVFGGVHHSILTFWGGAREIDLGGPMYRFVRVVAIASFWVIAIGIGAALAATRHQDSVRHFAAASKSAPLQSFRSRPDLMPPVITVTASSPSLVPGDFFLSPINAAHSGPMIVDAQGHLVWFGSVPSGQTVADFKVQQYGGQPVLTWWQGTIHSPGFGSGVGVIANSSYQQIAKIGAANGLHADLHEFLISPQDTALITAYAPVHADLRRVGGPASGIVEDTFIQEIDIKTGKLLFQWDALRHVPLADSYIKYQKGWTYDFIHINSIDVDSDGNLIVSARHTWTIYKIDRRSGAIVWRLGGKKSSFRMGPGTRFAWQHDARVQPNGEISVFDNGSYGTKTEPYSRGLVLAVNQASKSVTLVRSYTHAPALSAASQGSMQPMGNGDVLIGWGSEPYFSEYSAAGKLLFDAHFPAPSQSYRASWFPWSGQPSSSPALAASNARGKVTLFASWNGATQIASWQVLAGPSAGSLSALGSFAKADFETAMTVQTTQPYVAVQALSATGQVLGTSRVIKA